MCSRNETQRYVKNSVKLREMNNAEKLIPINNPSKIHDRNTQRDQLQRLKGWRFTEKKGKYGSINY